MSRGKGKRGRTKSDPNSKKVAKTKRHGGVVAGALANAPESLPSSPVGTHGPASSEGAAAPRSEVRGNRLIALFKKPWTAIGLIVSVIGCVLAALFLPPRIAISLPSQGIDPGAPLPLSFSITNTGFFDADDVEVSWYIRNLYSDSVTVKDTRPGGEPIGSLERGTTLDLIFPGVQGLDLKVDSDIELLVSYKAAWPFADEVVCSRFVVSDSSGRLAWFRRPASKCERLWSCLETRRRLQNGAAESADGGPEVAARAERSCVLEATPLGK